MLSRFRIVSFLEGLSYIFLLFVAMPLKHFLGLDEVVRYTGWVHGLLFISLIYGLVEITMFEKWSAKRFILGFVCALLPFGPFYFDWKLKKELEEAK